MKRSLAVAAILLMAASFVFARGQTATSGVPVVNVEVFNRGTDGGRSDPTNNNYTNWIKEKVMKDLGIQINFISIPRGEEIPALNNMMAAGNPPDICLTYDANVVANYRDLGGLFNMEPYINSLMRDLDRFLGEDPMLPGRRLVRRSTESSAGPGYSAGAIFSLVARRMNTARIATFIRGDWLDRLGIAPPRTTEEYYNAMVAFKNRDPGGVGANRVIPIITNVNLHWHLGNLLDSFIDPNISIRDEWVLNAGYNFLMPGYKEGVRYANRLFNEGLIDPDFPLYAKLDDEPFAKLSAGLAGSYQHNYDQLYRDSPGVYKNLAENVPGGYFITIDPFHHPSGNTKKYTYDVAGVFIIIPMTAKFPQDPMRYINWLSIFENNNFLQLGPEGIAWDMGADGVPRVKPAPGLWIQNSPQNIDYTLPINGLELGDPRYNMQALANSYNVDPRFIYECYENSLRNARPGPLIPVTLTAAGPYQRTLEEMGNQILTESIMCPPAQFDRIWDDWMRRYLAAGAQVIIDERAAKYVAP